MIDPTKLSPAQPEGGLSSFAKLLSIILNFDETEDGFSYANYLTCIGLMPDSACKPTHPFFFHASFPPEGPMEILPGEVADRVEDSFAELRESGMKRPHNKMLRRLEPRFPESLGLGSAD
jgi:hypothetical protein